MRHNPDPYRDEAYRQQAQEAFEELLQQVDALSSSELADWRYGGVSVEVRGVRVRIDAKGRVSGTFDPWSSQQAIQLMGFNKWRKSGWRDWLGLVPSREELKRFLRAVKYIFVHEYVHHLDTERAPREAGLAFSRDRYHENAIEFNARYQAAMEQVDSALAGLPWAVLYDTLSSPDRFVAFVRKVHPHEEGLVDLHLKPGGVHYKRTLRRLAGDFERLRKQYGVI